MNSDWKDIAIIITLSVVFFTVVVWNLGLTRVPTTGLQLTGHVSFYVDFGREKAIGNVYVLTKIGAANITVYKGSQGNWTYVGLLQVPFSYYSWSQFNVASFTRYVRFDVQTDSIQIDELAASGLDNKKIQVANVSSETASQLELTRLIDEQNLVQVPPTYLSETYFDEIYFARTAEQYLNGQLPYEWTHPPLGKLLQAVGILVFGYSPFGWRIMGVVFAALMIPVMYFFGKALLRSRVGAFTAAFLLTFDFMHFTMGRMGTADTYVVFFSMLSQLFFLLYLQSVLREGWKASVNPLFLSFVFFALGFSTKWIVIFGFAGLLLMLATLRLKEVVKLKGSFADKYAAFFDHPFLLLFLFAAVAVSIYLLMYLPDMVNGRTLAGVIQLQFEMYRYHSTLVATHPFASSWWSWPLMVSTQGYVPLWLFVAYLPNGVKSTIAVLGNPAVWWVGFACVLFITADLVKNLIQHFRRTRNMGQESVSGKGGQWDVAAIFIVTEFFIQWVPYILISRVTFIYHFYVCVPYLCFASAYFISRNWHTRRGKALTIAYFTIVLALFAAFYPVTSGIPASTSWINALRWFRSWYF
jgi:dolichyl-phosphate-mannose--protein O-mannosyl transferase